MTRQRLALGEPPDDLAGFPGVEMGEQQWYGAHRGDRDPWWFSHDMSGRFDLQQPRGTCYLGSEVEVAVRERLGEVLAHARTIPAPMIEDMAVSRLAVTGRAADTIDQEAVRYGVTRELGTLVPYGLSQRWAAAFDRGGWDGIRYAPRFSGVGVRMDAIGVFGSAGADSTRPRDPAPIEGHEAARVAGVRVAGIPKTVPVITPDDRHG